MPSTTPRGYEPVIGLEVHAQVLSKTKLFCGCSTGYGAPPNTNVCPVCLGLPGALPVTNGAAVEMATQAALALGSEIQLSSRFARKNYFYPDLPKGYQISQYDQPLASGGQIAIEVDGKSRSIGITRLHMEEDAAKNIHGAGRDGQTVIDFNRGGVPLMEIVSEPELRNAEEAEAYLKKLREILIFLGVNDGNLEEGSFRCDANVSLRPVGSTELGTRTELKNINSFRFVRKALESEIARQEAILSSGGEVVRETRTWSEASGKTLSMRGKEEAHDYRYFPDPDLPPLQLERARVEALKERMPELASEQRNRWQREAGLTAYDAQVLSTHPGVARFFDRTAALLGSKWGSERQSEAGKRAANFIQSELLRHVQTDGLKVHVPISPEHVAELLDLVEQGTISGKMAKDVLVEVLDKGLSPSQVVDAKGLAQVSDEGAIEAHVNQVLQAHPEQVNSYRGGNTKVLGFFVGKVMQATKGSANPKLVNQVLRKKLGEG